MLRKVIARFRKSRHAAGKLIPVRVGNYDLQMNADHPLPHYRRKFPTYCANLPRIAATLKEHCPDLLLIDIGANVGDTVAFCRSEADFPIVCIEGSDFYFPLLEKNLRQFEKVWAYQIYLGERDQEIAALPENSRGTGRLVKSAAQGSPKMRLRSLDAFLDENPRFAGARMLKVDTDGYDLMILRGAVKYLSRTKPVLFFEYDRVFLKEAGDDGLNTLWQLASLGYQTALFYDNLGRFMVSTTLDDRRLITQLHDYIEGRKSPFPYYDICLVHREDNEFATRLVRLETEVRKASSS